MDAHKLFAAPCTCLLAAAVPEQFPDTDLPEIAFIGRSNVGKSSLINALTGRKDLARASNTPGRTQQIVFFNLGDALMLVDLPGYGHAKAPKEQVKQWTGLVKRYLQTRPKLCVVCLLVDSRHGLMASDREMMAMLDKAAVSYQIILTKADKINPSERTPRHLETEAALRKHPAARPDVMLTSAEKMFGIKELREMMTGFTAL